MQSSPLPGFKGCPLAFLLFPKRPVEDALASSIRTVGPRRSQQWHMVMGSWISNPEPDRATIQKRDCGARYPLRSKVLTHSKHQLIDTHYQFIISKQLLIRTSISISTHCFQQRVLIACWIKSPQLNGHIGGWAASRCIKHMCSEPTRHIPSSRSHQPFLLIVSLIMP